MTESPIVFLCWRLPESVHELRRRAVTIVVTSDTTHPFAVPPQVYAVLMNLTDICKRSGIQKLLWKVVSSLIGQADKQNMTVHCWFVSKAVQGSISTAAMERSRRRSTGG